jgi:hypothetical protein
MASSERQDDSCGRGFPIYATESMTFFVQRFRFWLMACLVIALPIAGHAGTLAVSCRMACAAGEKACHSCCGDHKASCGMTVTKAVTASPVKAVSASRSASDIMPGAPINVPRILVPLVSAESGRVHDLRPPPGIDFQAAHCARLL